LVYRGTRGVRRERGGCCSQPSPVTKGQNKKARFQPHPPNHRAKAPHRVPQQGRGERGGETGPQGGGEKPQKGESSQVRYPFMRTQK